jgi:hypothetical protein
MKAQQIALIAQPIEMLRLINNRLILDAYKPLVFPIYLLVLALNHKNANKLFYYYQVIEFNNALESSG